MVCHCSMLYGKGRSEYKKLMCVLNRVNDNGIMLKCAKRNDVI